MPAPNRLGSAPNRLGGKPILISPNRLAFFLGGAMLLVREIAILLAKRAYSARRIGSLRKAWVFGADPSLFGGDPSLFGGK